MKKKMKIKWNSKNKIKYLKANEKKKKGRYNSWSEKKCKTYDSLGNLQREENAWKKIPITIKFIFTSVF